MLSRLVLTGIAVCAAAFAPASWPTLADGGANLRDGGVSVATDSKSNVYVLAATEGSTNSNDGLLLKYGKTGNLIWARVFGDPGLNETPRFLAIDSTSAPVVCYNQPYHGVTLTAIRKFTSSGGAVWAKNYIGASNVAITAASLVISPDNSAILSMNAASGSGNSIVTQAYSNNGTIEWTDTYSGDGSYDYANGACAGASGTVYVVGAFYNNAKGYDIGAIKYSPAGHREWVRKFDGTGRDDSAVSAAVDSESNVVVAGGSIGPSGTVDFETVKYSAAGQKLWEARAGSTSFSDSARKVVVDNIDNVVVGGFTGQGIGDFLIVKYDASGTKQWQKIFTGDPGGDHTNDNLVGVEVDESGSVYVGGTYEVAQTHDREYVLVKYNSDGKRAYVNLQARTEGYDSLASAMTRDATTGKIFMTGRGEDASEIDVFTARF